ncbi:glycosyltransferase [Pseudarthrobacter oxydans]|uniref:glycosyltransferase n=1 Tax=Pseudarthrobacter oxydans TaxID=1671 RepID=UPI003D2A7CDD
MRIMLLTAGTRGDVEPFVALAQAATARGHQVRTAIPENSGADTAGLETVSLRMDFAQLINNQGVSPWVAAKSYRTVIRPGIGQLLSAAVEHIAAFAPDVVVYHPKVLSAPIAAERLGIPSVLVETIPSLTATREFPAPFITTASLGRLNRASYRLANLATLMFKRELAAAVQDLPPRPRLGTRRQITMIPVSPQLLPRPADWPATVHLTGHWTGQPPETDGDKELADFIKDGGFVYAGFGSMRAGDPSARGEAIVQAARRNNLKTLVAGGWGGINIPQAVRGGDVLVREAVNHHLILPPAFAAIHHGGAGTVHAVARAGIPSVVVPFIADQPFWGHRLHQRGLAPAPVPYRNVTADRLADALAQARSCRDRAMQIGERIREEDGTGVALDALEAFAAS